MAHLSLRLLGGFELETDGRRLTLPPRKAQALLAYLALRPGRSHTREALTALLWSDTTGARARQSLRQTVLRVRRAFAAAHNRGFVVEGEQVRLDPAAVAVDVARFERLARQGTAEALQSAAALYQGPLLEGLRVEAGPLEDWLQSERERLHEQVREVLARLLELQMRRGPLEAAVQTANRLLAIDPLREDVHRTLMRLYLRQGRRGAALKHYQVCVGVLERELGVEPEPETRRVYREILQQQQARSTGGQRHAVSAALTPLVGRDAELRRLRTLAQAALGGRGQIVLVTGEAGIGKSRLVEELIGEHARRGGRVLVGRAYETEQILPLRPWLDALRTGRVVADAAREGELQPTARRELARVFPELAEPGTTPEITRESYVRLFDVLDGLIARLAAGGPVTVVIEDLHYADDMSLRFLAFLARRVKDRPVLLVGTAREEEMADAPTLRQMCQELDAMVEQVSLAALTEADTVRLVRALGRSGGHDARGAELARRVWALSEGNPFVIVETMRGARDHVPEGAGVSLPDRVRAMTLGRLERLGPKARQLVPVAAVIERDFGFTLLQEASGLGRRDTAEGLEELIRRRVLHAVEERFDFTHTRIRDTVYDSLLAPRRASLHEAVGRGLETAYANRHHEVFDRLAYHFARADDAVKTFGYLLSLADKAARSYALDDALRIFGDARKYVERLPAETRDRRWLDLVFGQVNTLTHLGRTREAHTLLIEQTARVERLGDASLTGLHLFWISYLLGTFSDDEGAVATARRALEESARAGDEATMGKASMVLTCESYVFGRALEGIAHGRQAVILLERTGERGWLAIAHRWLCMNLLHVGELAGALASAEQMCALGEALGDRSVEAIGAHSLCRVNAVAGEYAPAIASGRRAVEIAPEPVGRAYALGHLGTAYVEAGDATRAIVTLEESLAELRRLSAGGYRRHFDGLLMAYLSEAYLLKGEIDRAAEISAEAASLCRDDNFKVGTAYSERALGLVARARGSLLEACGHLETALKLFASIDTRFQVARLQLLLAEVCHAAGDTVVAAERLQASLETFRRLRVPRYVERAEQLAATLGVTVV